MSETNCPICFSDLEVADVTPCAECGNIPEEIEHTAAGIHTFAEMRIFGDLTLVLCNFCQVDFGSFHPEYFGLPRAAVIGYEKMQFLRTVDDVRIGKDKVCPNCKYRLAFLRFVRAARELHSVAKS